MLLNPAPGVRVCASVCTGVCTGVCVWVGGGGHSFIRHPHLPSPRSPEQTGDQEARSLEGPCCCQAKPIFSPGNATFAGKVRVFRRNVTLLRITSSVGGTRSRRSDAGNDTGGSITGFAPAAPGLPAGSASLCPFRQPSRARKPRGTNERS